MDGVSPELRSAKSIEQILSHEELTAIKHATDYWRKDRKANSFEEELRETNSIGMGDYQRDVDTDMLALPRSVDIAKESESYIRTLVDKGVKRVNVVDFGAGAAKTTTTVAGLVGDLVKEGKVHFVATNLYAAPTIEEVEKLSQGGRKTYHKDFTKEHKKFLQWALREKTVDFLRGDMIDLYKHMKGEPVHLMFNVNTSSTPGLYKINDAILKVTSEMLDPQFGTLVVDRNRLGGYPDQAIRNGKTPKQLFAAGVDYLKAKGFVDVYESMPDHKNSDGITVFQAPQAPSFRLAA
jgi:hypothetical protein